MLKLDRYWPGKTLPSHLKHDPKWPLIEWHVLKTFKKVFIGPEGLWRLWEQSETQCIVRLCHLRWIKEWVLVTCGVLWLDLVFSSIFLYFNLRPLCLSPEPLWTLNSPLKNGAFHFTGCGSVFNNTLKSPDYPNDYPSNMHCVYKIPITVGMALKITYQDFLLEYPNVFTGKW